jgi:hypothetical protein
MKREEKVREPPEPPVYTITDNSSYLEMPISAGFREVYAVLVNILAVLNGCLVC